MNILVINSGSSSLKYRLFDMDKQAELAAGVIDRIGEHNGTHGHRWGNAAGELKTIERARRCSNHVEALALADTALRETASDARLRSIAGIGHRVVHGGEAFQAATLINADVIDVIRRLVPLAPLHNPANLLGIEGCARLYPGVPQAAVFDTAFHQTMPARAYRYAVPQDFYLKHQVRRYGFHGTSHAYVARRTARYLGRELNTLNLITLHLGSGASATAIAAGKSVDTSMGLTPLEGLVMGTRCGDIDPAVLFYIGRVTGWNNTRIEALLNESSGIKGLCGVNDMREVVERAEAGDEPARLALSVFCYRIRKYVGAYLAVLGAIDALVFTGGVGENRAEVRALACEGMEKLGIRLDARRNASPVEQVSEIQASDADVKVLVVQTNEELEIANETMQLLSA